VIAQSPAYHDHSPQRLLQNFPDTTSTVSGRLEVRWTVTGGTDNEILALDWTESGGPEVQPFGAVLLDRNLSSSS